MGDFVRLTPDTISAMMTSLGRNSNPQDLVLTELEREDPVLYSHASYMSALYARDIVARLGVKNRDVKNKIECFLIELYLLGSAETRALLKRRAAADNLESQFED